MNKGRFVLGTIVGAVAGVVAGLLTAPKSGRETRADLKEKATELKENTSLRTKDLKHRSEKIRDSIDDKAEEYKDRGEKAAGDLKRAFNRKD